jgi:hypothetical protein
VRRAALVLVAFALTGCESTQEKSARLQRAAQLRPGHPQLATAKGLSIAHPSTDVKVVSATVVHGSEGNAAAITLLNESAEALVNVPIAITVRSASGATVYTNAAPALAHTLVSVPSLPAHTQLTWVDDQVQATGSPASVTAKVGEARAAGAPLPQLAVTGTHLVHEPAGGEVGQGSVVNHSSVNQSELVVYAVATRGGHVVAAGRAVLPELAAGASHTFQLFFLGDPTGARLSFSAAASTTG